MTAPPGGVRRLRPAALARGERRAVVSGEGAVQLTWPLRRWVPAWFGLSLVAGLPDRTALTTHSESFGLNLLALPVATTVVYVLFDTTAQDLRAVKRAGQPGEAETGSSPRDGVSRAA